jgi:hypothetical protein
VRLAANNDCERITGNLEAIGLRREWETATLVCSVVARGLPTLYGADR